MASTLEVECQICEAKQCLIDTQSPRFNHLVPKLEKMINSQEQHRNWLRFMCLPCKAKLDNSWKFQTLCRSAYRKFLDNLEEIAYIDVKDECENVDTKFDRHFSAVDRNLLSKENSTIPVDRRDEKQINIPIIRRVRIAKPMRGMLPKEQPRGPLPTVADYLANSRMQLPTVPMKKSKICHAAKDAEELDVKNVSLIQGIDAEAYNQSFEMVFVPGDIAPVKTDSDDSDEEFSNVSSRKDIALPTVVAEHKKEFEVKRIISKPAKEEKTETSEKEKVETLEKVEEPESKLPEKPPVEPTKNKSHECSLCNRMFRSKSTIRQHIKEVHQKFIKAVCDICGKGFSRTLTYLNHMETHNENRSRFSCAICNKVFTIKENLKRHLIGIHIDRSKRQRCKRRCKHCRALFRTREEINEHLQTAHPVARSRLLRFSYAKHSRVRSKGYKSRKCQYCSKECTTLQGLEVHERIHTGEKPFACEICAKTFRQDQHLKTHMNTHTGTNRFPCEYCDKVFTQAGNLRVHRRVHTGEKPYECSTCSQRFPEQKMWKKHSAKCSEES